MIEKTIKYFLFVLLVSVFWMPLFFKRSLLINEKKLEGAFDIPDSTFVLNDTNWLSGTFQNKYEKWYNYNMGLHRTGVRFTNQINFCAKEQFPNVVVGKENELMGLDYIEAYLGKDFVGQDSIEKECMRLRVLKDSLNRRGIKFFIAIAPNKSRIRAKYIPDFFHPENRKDGNYKYYTDGFKKQGIPVVDFEKWFEQINDTSRYPLFSNLGVHWGNYGAMLCSDSLLKYIQANVGREINRPRLKKIFVSDSGETVDYDMANVLNVMGRIQPRDKFVNFYWDFIQDSTKFFPDVMVIGDSYYWNIMNFGIPKLFSKKFRYLYYNYIAYYNDGNSKEIGQLNLKEEVLSEKIIFFLYTEPNLHNLGSGFTEKVLREMQKP